MGFRTKVTKLKFQKNAWKVIQLLNVKYEESCMCEGEQNSVETEKDLKQYFY